MHWMCSHCVTNIFNDFFCWKDWGWQSIILLFFISQHGNKVTVLQTQKTLIDWKFYRKKNNGFWVSFVPGKSKVRYIWVFPSYKLCVSLCIWYTICRETHITCILSGRQGWMNYVECCPLLIQCIPCLAHVSHECQTSSFLSPRHTTNTLVNKHCPYCCETQTLFWMHCWNTQCVWKHIQISIRIMLWSE